ncbi:ly6/PLAUR domain-containing protein 3 [Myotis lucifugus]|uniref:ly6/PLAUR domain-containing protein 3 n=1 Tax=Myotis lucifugus TaxID=59463 RepID=UPI000CCC7B95|nr:ly6/PLAUR domain-containing protein 3 [Myotis lucifugus]
MDPARKAGAQAVIWTTGWLLLLLPMLLQAKPARAVLEVFASKFYSGGAYPALSSTPGLCVSPSSANVTVSLPVRGCVQDEFCTRDAVTGPGFTLSGSCCKGSRCNADLRNKTFFSPRIPPLVLLPVPRSTTPAATTPVVTTSARAPTKPVSTTKSSPASASQTPPKAVEPKTAHKEESSVAGGASGHQDRSNKEQYPTKTWAHNQGSAAPAAGLAALLLAVAAGALL